MAYGTYPSAHYLLRTFVNLKGCELRLVIVIVFASSSYPTLAVPHIVPSPVLFSSSCRSMIVNWWPRTRGDPLIMKGASC